MPGRGPKHGSNGRGGRAYRDADLADVGVHPVPAEPVLQVVQQRRLVQVAQARHVVGAVAHEGILQEERAVALDGVAVCTERVQPARPIGAPLDACIDERVATRQVREQLGRHCTSRVRARVLSVRNAELFVWIDENSAYRFLDGNRALTLFLFRLQSRTGHKNFQP